MAKDDLVRAAALGDAEAVRRYYTPALHAEANEAALAARQWRITSLLAELQQPKTATKARAKSVKTATHDDGGNEHTLLDAFSHPQDAWATNAVDMTLYRALPPQVFVDRFRLERFAWAMSRRIDALGDRARLDSSLFGDNPTTTEYETDQRNEPSRDKDGVVRAPRRFFPKRSKKTGEVLTKLSPDLYYAYTAAGDRGPVVVFAHGVPTNREQWAPVQKIVSRWCRTLSIDLLGMGESSQPLDMPDAAWDWRYDAVQWDIVFDSLVRGRNDQGTNAWGAAASSEERIVLVADDWGAGPATHFAELYSDKWLLGLVLQDPIALDGYPVAEIQAFGRLHGIFQSEQSDEQKRALFRTVAGAADQTMVQIFKTMVHDPSKYNQYVLRTIKRTYVDVDYERLAADGSGEDATSLTLRLNFHALRVMAARSARLAPALLLPYDARRNPRGVEYDRITADTLLLWGAKDNMMPEAQLHRLRALLKNSRVHTHSIADAGHFAATDQPLAVAEELLKFVANRVGIGRLWRPPGSRDGSADQQPLADVFFGLTGIWKGDEAALFADTRRLYGVKL